MIIKLKNNVTYLFNPFSVKKTLESKFKTKIFFVMIDIVVEKNKLNFYLSLKFKKRIIL